MKSVIIFIVILTSSFFAKAQLSEKNEISRKLTDHLFFQLQHKTFKDSVAIYTFVITVDLTNANKNPVITNVNSTDSLAFKAFKNLDTLKKLDFTSFKFTEKKVRLILPTAIVIKAHNGSKRPGTLLIMDLPELIYKLLKVSNPNIRSDIYLNPFVIEVDLSAY
jgi:hypothetical protein